MDRDLDEQQLVDRLLNDQWADDSPESVIEAEAIIHTAVFYLCDWNSEGSPSSSCDTAAPLAKERTYHTQHGWCPRRPLLGTLENRSAGTTGPGYGSGVVSGDCVRSTLVSGRRTLPG